MTTLPPEFFYSLTLCITMLGLMAVMYWYHKTVTPFTGLKNFEGIASINTEDSELLKKTLRLLIIEFDHKPLVWVSVAHTVVAIVAILLNAIVDFSLTLSIIIAAPAVTTYMVIIAKRLRIFNQIIEDAQRIQHYARLGEFDVALRYLKRYPNIDTQNAIALGYLKRQPDFAYTLLYAYHDSISEKDIELEMRQFISTYKMTPLDALNRYEWPNTMRNALAAMLT